MNIIICCCLKYFVLCIHGSYHSLINTKPKMTKYSRKINKEKDIKYEVTKQMPSKIITI